MDGDELRSYEIEGREPIAQADGLRVQVLTIGPGQCVPWHRHTHIVDTFLCMQGPMVVETQNPDARHVLEPGNRVSIPPGRPHTVYPSGAGRCKFVIVQGVGEYDFVPLDRATASRMSPRGAPK